MILFACGDSYTYGEELDDRTKSYPYILGQLLNSNEIVNKGICSGSNEYIFKSLNDFVIDKTLSNNTDELFVVIGWSSSIRWEAYLSDYSKFVQLKIDRSLRFVDTDKCAIIREDNIVDSIMSKTKLQVYNDIVQDFICTFKRNSVYNMYCKYNLMFSAHRMLISYGIKHIFFNSLYEDNEFKDVKLGKNELKLLSKIRELKLILNSSKCMISNTTMDRYCKSYPIGSKEGHPLEDGHKAWAEYIFKQIQ